MPSMRLSVSLRSMAPVLLLLLMLLLGGCSTLGYYYQSVHGHFSLMGNSRSIDDLLQDGAVTADLKKRLELVRAARRFASAELGLPQNDSYQSYASLDREAVVWSVVATPEFSVQPKQWCYPVVGCASYRGYFKKGDAQRYGDDLRQQGMDVTVLPNPAYSTLGWFDDPLPSTVINWPEPYLVGLIFHELAHQQLYVSGDSAFNEAFAMTVEQVGVERWFMSRRDMHGLKLWRERKQLRDEFTTLLLDARGRLQQLYAATLTDSEKRMRKRAEFARLKTEYLQLKTRRKGAAGFDRWFEADLNNARLASVATYDRFVPAFVKLLHESKGDLKSFYQTCKILGELSQEQRRAKLESLL
jgi:predicted aminopeptidase